MTLMLALGALMVLTDRPARLLETLEPLPKVNPVKPYRRQHQRPGALAIEPAAWASYALAFVFLGIAAAALIWG
jgi:hypothetical protein